MSDDKKAAQQGEADLDALMSDLAPRILGCDVFGTTVVLLLFHFKAPGRVAWASTTSARQMYDLLCTLTERWRTGRIELTTELPEGAPDPDTMRAGFEAVVDVFGEELRTQGVGLAIVAGPTIPQYCGVAERDDMYRMLTNDFLPGFSREHFGANA